MPFRDRRSEAKPPDVNLTPMLNVMMGILAFFVMITMSLSTQQGLDVPLPPNPDRPPPPNPTAPDPLLIRIQANGQLWMNEQIVSQTTLIDQSRQYLAQDPAGFVVLMPDRQLPYADVVQLLSDLQVVGGDRISLVIDQ